MSNDPKFDGMKLKDAIKLYYELDKKYDSGVPADTDLYQFDAMKNLLEKEVSIHSEVVL